MRALLLGLFAVGCTTSAPLAGEPAPDEVLTVSPPEPGADEGFERGPWSGRLRATTLHYWNGCTDRREVEVIALARGGARIPIVLGWRRASPRHREEPHFLKSVDELPAGVRGHACVVVTGSVVAYAHQGISGAPAYGVAATHFEPAACP